MGHRIPQRREVGSDGEQDGCGQHPCSLCEAEPCALLAGEPHLAEPQRRRGQREVICYLRVVGSQFERQRQCRQCAAGPHVAPERTPHARDHERRVCQRPHLGYMSRVDYQEEVCRKAVCQRGDDAYPRVDAYGQQRDPHQQHGEEYHAHRLVQQLYASADGALYDLCRILHVDQICRHAREHGSRPLRVFARGFAALFDVLPHTRVLARIALHEGLALELRREKYVADAPECHQRRQCGQYVS